MAIANSLQFALILLLFVASIAAKKPSLSSARREDVPFIKCQVCNKIAHQIHQQIANKAAQIAPKKVSEFEIIEVAENVCNLKKQQADWILQIDIVEKGDKLELVEQGIEGQCNSECKTIERACEEVMGYADTDIAEFFFKTRPSVEQLVNFLCKDLTKSCLAPPPPVPKDRKPGEPFLAKPTGEAEMEKLMKSMEGMPGAPNMKMYSKEDILNNRFGDDDADDDDDEDEDHFPSKLSKILKEKAPPKKDFKERILHGARETGKQIKGHVDKVSKRIRKWWQSQMSSSSKKTKKIEL